MNFSTVDRNASRRRSQISRTPHRGFFLCSESEHGLVLAQTRSEFPRGAGYERMYRNRCNMVQTVGQAMVFRLGTQHRHERHINRCRWGAYDPEVRSGVGPVLCDWICIIGHLVQRCRPTRYLSPLVSWSRSPAPRTASPNGDTRECPNRQRCCRCCCRGQSLLQVLYPRPGRIQCS